MWLELGLGLDLSGLCIAGVVEVWNIRGRASDGNQVIKKKDRPISGEWVT